MPHRASTESRGDSPRGAHLFTAKELEALIGEKLPPKREFQMAGGELYRRVADVWERYPPYPAPPADA